MKLTLEEDRDRIRRYAHVKPARGRKAGSCSTTCPGTSYGCTLERGHTGPHVAHGRFRRVVAVWDSDARARRSVETAKRASEARAGRAARTGRPAGVLEALRRRVVRAVGSVEEVVFLVLFLGFLGFAVHWFMLILG